VHYADGTGTHQVSLAPGVLRVQENEVLILVGGALEASEEGVDLRFERLSDTLLGALDASQ
jgi:hypothetical protein